MHVEDVADRILQLAVLEGRKDRVWVVNVATGRGQLLKAFVIDVARELGGESLMKFGAVPYRSGEMRALVADTSRLQATIPSRSAMSLARAVRGMTSSLHVGIRDQ
jgi:nucleoside-diphosphate-sugar epimerase